MENIKIKFGLKIKELRKQKSYSQEKLAKLASIEKSYISNIENGSRNVSLEVICKLAKAFEIEIDQLFD
ncbi:transcriptional regulator [Flavobacterium faecale]|uniref:Transcriptional regulator n=1 Tax=Flavobacterium faecale TaxID=1355330 RepID=A0A2S1LFW5_9FLAO|nr:helix-turn-helix transcriptional regulator [Flavobacterium faecale]AWG22589.1 transcriptional regulator [Flavobacterium faecale]